MHGCTGDDARDPRTAEAVKVRPGDLHAPEDLVYNNAMRMPGSNQPIIDILCRVVDNLGDIGVVRRLSRALSDVRPDLRIRLVVDDLEAFHILEPAVDPMKPVQTIGSHTVIRWDHPWDGFLAERPRAVVETFGCGFPPRYEELLFDESDRSYRLVVDLEYLSAEAWASEYHLLPAPARHPCVRKITVMPGFRPGTGGLIRDRRFLQLRDKMRIPESRNAMRRELAGNLGLRLSEDELSRPWIFLFTYGFDWRRTIRETASSGLNPVALVAAGGGAERFLNDWDGERRPFRAVRLPFVSQDTFDALLLCSDFLIVRGEETLARASLSGIPFLWQAYPLENGDHREKVDGFLDVLSPFLSDGSGGRQVADAFRALNAETGKEASAPPGINIGSLLSSLPDLSSRYTSFSIAAESMGDITFLLLSIFTDFV